MHTMKDSPNCLVYILDDDEGVRDSLAWMLEGKGYRTQCFGSAEEFLAGFNKNRLACLITDIRMDGMSGLQLQDKLLEGGIKLPMAFITGHGDVPLAVSTMKKGALDFIQKPFEEKAIVELVEKMQAQAVELFAEAQTEQQRQNMLSKLTARESQVIERIAAGRLNKQIADDLDISIKTVEAHRANIMEKLGAHTVADLMKVVLGGKSA